MNKIGFIGVYDKTDLILCIAKVLKMTGKKVLIVDATTTQKCKYVVPVINPTVSYITEFEEIDVAIGFNNFEEIRRYIGLEDICKKALERRRRIAVFLNFCLQKY